MLVGPTFTCNATLIIDSEFAEYTNVGRVAHANGVATASGGDTITGAAK